jgi:outer membrane lipoprotein SlyB
MSIDNSPGAVRTGKLPTAWIAAGVLGAVSVATAATIALRPSAAPVRDAVAQATPASTTAKLADSTKPGDDASAAPKAAPPAVRHAKAPAANGAATRVAAVCAHCGVVESVVAVKRKGEGTGLGAVAGGVLGGVVGHQMGNGNGNKAMTVLGAVGGGLAGHEVEKRARGTTVYQVHVRMDDNTERTLEQAEPPHVGARVEVQGGTLRALHTAG